MYTTYGIRLHTHTHVHVYVYKYMQAHPQMPACMHARTHTCTDVQATSSHRQQIALSRPGRSWTCDVERKPAILEDGLLLERLEILCAG